MIHFALDLDQRAAGVGALLAFRDLGAYRDIASIAVKFGSAVLAYDGPEAGRNVLEAIIELTDFDQPGLATHAALGAFEDFSPAESGHASSMRNQSRAV
jgi:hypothetical protein